MLVLNGTTTEHATETKEEDWALIMEICDAINDTDEGFVCFYTSCRPLFLETEEKVSFSFLIEEDSQERQGFSQSEWKRQTIEMEC